jgi:hypothetical protein
LAIAYGHGESVALPRLIRVQVIVQHGHYSFTVSDDEITAGRACNYRWSRLYCPEGLYREHVVEPS